MAIFKRADVIFGNDKRYLQETRHIDNECTSNKMQFF